jgi:branched-subunit amino acid transport protein
MTEGVWLWITFGVMGLITIGLRGSFIILGDRARLPPRTQRALR